MTELTGKTSPSKIIKRKLNMAGKNWLKAANTKPAKAIALICHVLQNYEILTLTSLKRNILCQML